MLVFSSEQQRVTISPVTTCTSFQNCLFNPFAHMLTWFSVLLFIFEFFVCSGYRSFPRWVAGKAFPSFFRLALLSVNCLVLCFLICHSPVCQLLLVFPEQLKSYSESHYLCMHSRCFLMLSLRSLKVLTLSTLIPFALVFAQDEGQGYRFIILYVDI